MIRTSSAIIREHHWSGEKLSLLAVFAHPEDESFGPAGTLAKYASEGIQVSLVAATRDHIPPLVDGAATEDSAVRSRDRACSCRASGIRRACLFDHDPGELSRLQLNMIEERLVRVIRETEPQVIITFGPRGLTGDSDHQIINAATHAAFRNAGDPNKFQHHFLDGLGTFTPQKLYYCVLPQSLVSHWGVRGLEAVPDSQITTVLDVSGYAEAMKNALYCQRHHALDFIRWLTEDQRIEWNAEYYALVESRVSRKPRREKDLFADLR